VFVGQQPLGNILLGTGRERLVAFSTLAEAIVNLVLSIILVRRIGLLGVAIGTIIPVVAANLFVLAPAACRQVGIGIIDFARSVAVAPLVGALIAALAGAALRGWWPPQSVPAILAEGACVGAVYMLAVWTVGFDAVVRSRYSAYGRQLLVTALSRGTASA
jgi:O-antigen/teichoic acid export membrane protein